MARPTKQGVDYFPLDVHMDDKIKFVEIKYKLEGFAIVIKLMQRIYSQGYWCKWTEDELLLFSDEIKADIELVKNVVDECLNRGFFNKKLYDDYNILTSNGIQKRYKEIVRRRKDVNMIEEYLLIDGNWGVNDDINPTSSRQDDDKSTQSKVNKTKEDNKERSKLKFETHHLKLSELLFKEIRKNNASAKEPNLEDWANTFRLMMERDKRNGKDIQDVILFCQSHEFWHMNILSADKLRKQFDRLYMEMNKGNGSRTEKGSRKVADF